jgi:hypothetical protein
MIYELSFRGPGGAVTPGQLSVFQKPGYVAIRSEELIAYDQVTFLVHGFNVKEEEGRQSLSKLATQLPAAHSGAVVFVLWPGDSPIGPLSYPFTEGNQALDTAVELTRTIKDHVSRTTPLNFVAHSLGCRVVLETIKHLHREAKGKRDIYPVKQVCLMAAAADDYVMSIPDTYKPSVERAGRVVVLSSVEDEVLKYIYPLGDLIQAFIFFWKETFGLALGYHGPKQYTFSSDFYPDDEDIEIIPVPANVTPVAIDKDINVNHGDYLPSAKADNKQKKKQKAATLFANAVIAGQGKLSYQIK